MRLSWLTQCSVSNDHKLAMRKPGQNLGGDGVTRQRYKCASTSFDFANNVCDVQSAEVTWKRKKKSIFFKFRARGLKN